MKTYFRLLSFAKPIEKFAIPYIIYTILYVIFSTLVLTMLGPLLNVLFDSSVPGQTAPHAAVQQLQQPGILDLIGWFKYYLLYYKQQYISLYDFVL